MKKILALLLVAAFSVLLLSGCSVVSALTSKVDALTQAELVVRVMGLEETGVRAKVIHGDSHFEVDTMLYLYFDQIVGTNRVALKDEITVCYDYSTNVTSDSGTPVITVEVVSLYAGEDG